MSHMVLISENCSMLLSSISVRHSHMLVQWVCVSIFVWKMIFCTFHSLIFGTFFICSGKKKNPNIFLSKRDQTWILRSWFLNKLTCISQREKYYPIYIYFWYALLFLNDLSSKLQFWLYRFWWRIWIILPQIFSFNHPWGEWGFEWLIELQKETPTTEKWRPSLSFGRTSGRPMYLLSGFKSHLLDEHRAINISSWAKV